MSRQLIVRDWCDVCQRDDDAQVEGQTWTMALDGKPRTLELCEVHYAQLVKPLQDVLAELGRKPDDGAAPTRAPGRPRKALDAPGAQDGASVPQRGRKARQQASEAAAPELAADNGYPCVICGRELGRSDYYRRHLVSVHGLASSVLQGDTCPVCGQSGLSKMGVHVSGFHGDLGLRNSAQALVWARDNGDPYGAYAAVMAAAGDAT